MADSKRKFYRILARQERLDFIMPITKEAKKNKSEKRTPTNPELWSRAKAEAKKRFKVWPSAYCVPVEAQAFTRQGWKDYYQVKKGDEILAFSMETEDLEWTKIEDIYFYSNTPTFNMFNSDRSLDLVCTPNHKWPVFNGPFKQLIETRNLLREGAVRGIKKIEINSDLTIDWTPEIIFLSNVTIIEGYNKDVWCPQTKHKTWVMKYGERIIITGNSSGWAVKWYKEHGGGWRGKKPIK